MDRLLLLIVSLSFLPPGVAAVQNQCPLAFEELTKAEKKLFIPPTEYLEHVVRFGDSFGAPSRTDFIGMMMKAGNSTKGLQEKWLPVSFGAVIWTTPKGKNGLSTGNGFFLKIKTKSDFSFYDIGKDPKSSLWNKWLRANKNRKNGFPKAQAKELKDAGIPYHSAFYEDYKLAGYVHRYGSGSAAFNIVDARAIQEIRLTREQSLKELREALADPDGVEPKKRWPAAWEKSEMVFRPK